MYTVLKVHLSPFKQDLNFGNRVRYVFDIPEICVLKWKKNSFC